jgi:hypothetical protein
MRLIGLGDVKVGEGGWIEPARELSGVMWVGDGTVGMVGSAEWARRARAFEATVGAMTRGSAEWARVVRADILMDVVGVAGW